MKTLFSFTGLVALCLSTLAMSWNNRNDRQAGSDIGVSELTNAPYRDGLYVGNFLAKNGGTSQIPSGRWATVTDRALFTAGFERGYRQGPPSLYKAPARRATIAPRRRTQRTFQGLFYPLRERSRGVQIGNFHPFSSTICLL